ncbi:hypothetical protein PSY27_23640, partial [Shigella flexneri]|nr:hypothetical protein [Shigella flexneri]
GSALALPGSSAEGLPGEIKQQLEELQPMNREVPAYCLVNLHRVQQDVSLQGSTLALPGSPGRPSADEPGSASVLPCKLTSC